MEKHTDLILADLGVDELEAIVDRGRITFLEVGSALAEIRERGHYRLTHGMWEDYVQARFGFSIRRAQQLMKATRETKALPPGETPKNEREARARNTNHGSPNPERKSTKTVPTGTKPSKEVEGSKPPRRDGMTTIVLSPPRFSGRSTPTGKPGAQPPGGIPGPKDCRACYGSGACPACETGLCPDCGGSGSR